MKFKKLYNTVDECCDDNFVQQYNGEEFSFPLVEDENGETIVSFESHFDEELENFVDGFDVDLDHNGAYLFYAPEQGETLEELYQEILKHLEEI